MFLFLRLGRTPLPKRAKMEHTVSDLDPVTQTNYLQITSEHVHFDWTIDFDAKVIFGSATHTLVAHKDDVSEVM